jgi:hypothetical protein
MKRCQSEDMVVCSGVGDGGRRFKRVEQPHFR